MSQQQGPEQQGPGQPAWGPVAGPPGAQPDGPQPPDGPRPGGSTTGAKPLLVGGGALVLVLVVVLVVAYLTAQAGPSGQPTTAPSAPPPPLELPLTAGDLSRDPNQPDEDTGIDTDIETVSATYARAAEPTVVVIAGRPLSDPAAMLDLVEAEAVRPIEDGLCGRYPSGYDVCAVVRGSTALLGVGIAGQPVQDLLDDTQTVAAALPQ
ncbi:hypothetical protein GC722_02800 [Auraticoccus sp. F435]|uniref:Uncharacterized protein n=1 Tax=Auraticoccus cholistanensis TaxID=2656650 RepID=A0A6A9UTG9_9ACTN|nr:hypothetical protein [Auraticoccus cholistanensis]MVA74962.1 hypothetical protein [Auraticoccus cholistanensis]